jgi:hypothetical protein
MLLILDIPVIETDDLLRKLFYNFNARRSSIIFYTDENLKNLTIEFYIRFLNSHSEYKLIMPSISPKSLNELYSLSQYVTRSHILIQNLNQMPKIKTINNLAKQNNTVVIFFCWDENTNYQLSKINAEWYELQ